MCNCYKDKLTWSSAMSGGVWVICSFRYLMALPILTDRGRHWVKKLKTKIKTKQNRFEENVTNTFIYLQGKRCPHFSQFCHWVTGDLWSQALQTQHNSEVETNCFNILLILVSSICGNVSFCDIKSTTPLGCITLLNIHILPSFLYHLNL